MLLTKLNVRYNYNPYYANRDNSIQHTLKVFHSKHKLTITPKNTQQLIGIKFLNNIFLKNHILKDKIESFENIFLGKQYYLVKDFL